MIAPQQRPPDKVAQSPAPQAVRVAVLLPRMEADTGEWLAECAAYDAAGADALWLDGGPDPAYDVLTLAAALAAGTDRAQLVVALPDSLPPAAWLARTLATVGALSGNRLALAADARRCAELVAVAPAVPALRRLAAGTPGHEEPGAGRWVPVPAPRGRAAWRDSLADAAKRRLRGLVVPADPLLLDTLRNPDDPGGRPDLHLAQG